MKQQQGSSTRPSRQKSRLFSAWGWLGQPVLFFGVMVLLVLPELCPVSANSNPATIPENTAILRQVAPSDSRLFLPALLGLDNQLWGSPSAAGDRPALATAIDQSLIYLDTPEAQAAYAQYSL